MQSSYELSVEIILSGAYCHQKSLSMDTNFFPTGLPTDSGKSAGTHPM